MSGNQQGQIGRGPRQGGGWRAERYASVRAAAWDALIAAAGNGPFLFRRSYLDYHADQFADCSWLLWRGEKLGAVFVAGQARATTEPAVLVAHPGLAYGGLVHPGLLPYEDVAAIMEVLRAVWRAQGWRQLRIRPVPRAFCRLPADGLSFWLHRQGAQLVGRELNSVIDLMQDFRIGTWRRGNLRQARRHGLHVALSADYAAFWLLLTANLHAAHGRQPVHSAAEIELLDRQNPGCLSLYAAYQEAEMVAGVVLFQDRRQGFAHTQYIAGSPRGKLMGAVDAVLAHIIEVCQPNFRRLSFGISTVSSTVNYGLLNQKEGFGAAAETQDTYQLDF